MQLFFSIKISYLQPFREIMGEQTKRQFSTKNDATGQQKMTFFEISFLLHIYLSRRNFFVFNKISYHQPFREFMGGGKQNVNYPLKMTPQAKKMTFFGFFFLLHIFTSIRNFFVITKITYIQPLREIMGDKEKALHRTTNERTTNERTTNYIDDDNSPPGFFQNPRANNWVIFLPENPI